MLPTTLLLTLLPTLLTASALPSTLLLPRAAPPSCCTEALNAQSNHDTTAYNNAIAACAARGCTAAGGSVAPAAEVNTTAVSTDSNTEVNSTTAVSTDYSNKWQERWVEGCSDCEGVEGPFSCYCSPCRFLPNGCV